MKSTPDVPPVLIEIVAEIRALEQDVASSLRTQIALLNGDSFAYAGDWHSDRFQYVMDEASRIAKRLEEVAAKLAKPWPK